MRPAVTKLEALVGLVIEGVAENPLESGLVLTFSDGSYTVLKALGESGYVTPEIDELDGNPTFESSAQFLVDSNIWSLDELASWAWRRDAASAHAEAGRDALERQTYERLKAKYEVDER